MAIRSLKTGSFSRSTQVGNSIILPGDYESIATTTVGAGGASSVTFSSIPSTFTHLQIRALAQTNRGTYGIDQLVIQLNSDTGNNYARHYIYGDGASTAAGGSSTTNMLFDLNGSVGTSTGGTFGGLVIDILDYANTSKYKTGRVLSGVDINGTIAGFGGRVGLFSGVWQNTAAVSTITITPSVGTLITQYSHFALYGIRG